MKSNCVRAVAALCGLVCGAAVLDAAAITIEPLPGSTPQSTRAGAFFPNDVGVIVRDDTGQPLSGVAVHFRTEGLALSLFGDHGDFAGQGVDTVSDEQGVASLPWLDAMNAGNGYVFATLSGAPELVFALSVDDGIPWYVRALDGMGQSTPAGETFSRRWVVRIEGEDRQAIPFACAMFWDTDPFNQGGSFG